MVKDEKENGILSLFFWSKIKRKMVFMRAVSAVVSRVRIESCSLRWVGLRILDLAGLSILF